jgi:predicted transposase/invertase (TIGR01784 family)
LVTILENKTFSADIVGDKTSILDVRAITDKDEKVNIEVQLKDFHNMEKRTLVHWSREYLQGIEAGDDYKILPKVITINIVNFDYIKLDEFHTSFHLREDKHREYIMTDVLEIHFLNMVKFRKHKIKNIENPLERWLTFFDINTPDKKLEEVIKMDTTIQKAANKINHVTRDKEFLRQYNLREMAMSDYTTGINTAMEKGIEKGRAEGIEKGRVEGEARGEAKGEAKNKLETAQKLLLKKMPVKDIAEVTGLSLAEIKKLAKADISKV